MAESKELSGIPSWDGSARTWRRYTREVSWFVQATPVHKRRYCSSKLLGRLSGPARLLAMSWSKMAFDSPDGTRLLLQRLAASPLVRKTLPNAAAICQQYFSFKRNPQESIGNFLVRETLVHEEFTEAIIRLHEEKLGLTQESRDFGLPRDEWSGGDRWDDGSWWDDRYYDQDYEEAGDDDHHPDGDPPYADGDDPGLPQQAPGTGNPSATTGSSPSHRPPSLRDAAVGSASPLDPELPKGVEAIDELAIADSFVMGVLRGWRLLQAAGLTAEEKRDILSTTKNSLDYENISSALQSLWDDQLLSHRYQRGGADFYAHQVEQFDHGELYYQESDDWWQNSDGGWWHDGFYQENDSYDWWEDDSWYYQEQNMATEPEDPETSEKLKEAQKAERVAESLAIEASRTWADAQRATQALRKDRGFGLHSSPGGGPSGKCFICGGNHFARECPDRQHPGKSYSKGKGKFKGYMTEYEDLNYSSKGKFKGKGKGMNNHWLENFGTWKGNKGRGKPMHKSKDAPRSVNAYASDMLLAGLEVLEAQSSSASSSTDPGTGMIDCGATASAAPEAVVKSLIDTVLTHDKGAIIELDQSARPYFRFGNGRWGRALCRVHISSAVSGRTRQFSLYTLPNPAEYVSNNFDRSYLVPVLIGMDHLGHKGVGMMIDFSLGLAMNTLDENPEIYHLDKNHKGHFMLDIVQYLTQGQRSHDGQPHVIVRSSSSSSPQQEEHQFLELGTVYMDMTLQDHELDAQMLQAARDRMTHMFQYAQHRRSPAALTAQMPVDACVNNSVSTTSSSCPSGHVALPDADSRGQRRERDQEANASCKGEGQAPRLCLEDSHRQTGSSLLRESVALSQPPHGQQGDEQHARKLGPLRMLQRSSGVCTPDRKCSSSHQGGVSGNGEPNAGGIGATNGTAPSHSENLLGHDGEDQCGGEASHSDLRAEDGDYINRPWIHERRGSPQQPGRLHQRVLDQHGDRGSGNGLRTRGQPTVTPLPLSVGKKIMSMATMLMAFTSSLLLSLHLGPRDGLWEVACAPHSWLSMAADEHGLQPRRINLQQGYDLYQASTWDRLREERRQRRPRRIWFSLPCAKWCAWTSINYSSPDRQVVLETARRRERKLLWYVNVFIKETLDEDDSVEIYFEWPWPCFGWKQQPLLDLAAYMDKKMIPWLDCRIDGCNYGMRDPHGQFIQKKWLVKTTSEKFHKVFRAKVCQGGHGVHANIQGQLTSASAYYPWRLVQAIARHWRDATVPHRHIHLLHQRDEPLHEQQSSWSMVMDEFEVVTDIQELAVSEENEITIASAEVIQLEYTARTYRMSRQITSQMCEEILMSMYYGVNLKKDDHSKWKTSSFHLVFGGYSRGGFCGCTLATTRYPETVQLLNAYLQRLLPQHTWTSIMVTFNGKSVPRKDHHNLPGTLNATICLGSFTGGEMWLAGSPPAGTVPTRRRRTDGTMVDGYLVNTYGQPVIFSPSILHATQDWKGFRIAITAYTTRMYPTFDVDDNRRLHKLGFPLPRRQSQELQLTPPLLRLLGS